MTVGARTFTLAEKLAGAKAGLNLPTIVCICGSLRFQDDMHAAAVRESLAGRIVVMPLVNTKLWHSGEAAKVKDALHDLHRAKLRLADEVLVVGDYVGDSTHGEIAYARGLGLPVRFTHPEVDPVRQAANEVA